MLSGAEITPEGDLYTGWAEYELRFGRRLTPWDQPTRTLPDPALPLLSSALSDGPVRYVQTVFAVAVAGLPVAYDTVTVTNGSDRPREARVAMALAYTRGRQLFGAHGVMTGAYRYERPVTGGPGFYDQPGQPFSQAFVYSASGRDLRRSGLLLARGPAASSRPLGAAAVSRAPGASTVAGRTAPHDGRLFAVLLEGGRPGELHLADPAEPAAGRRPRRQRPGPDAPERRPRRAQAHVERRRGGHDEDRRAGGQGERHLPRGDHRDPLLALPDPGGLGAGRQQASIPGVLDTRRRDRDAGVGPRRPAHAGRAEPGLHGHPAAARRAVHQPPQSIRRARTGAMGDQPARPAQHRSGLRPGAARPDRSGGAVAFMGHSHRSAGAAARRQPARRRADLRAHNRR